jgi:L-ascorbate metabolism protein UlaG (beta-lactamase superfamily)
MISYDRPIKTEGPRRSLIRVRWLGWAGVEIEANGASLVIDPLADPGATFAALGERAAAVELPAVTSPEATGTAVASLVSHLHRDHADAGALAGALDPAAHAVIAAGCQPGHNEGPFGLASSMPSVMAGWV